MRKRDLGWLSLGAGVVITVFGASSPTGAVVSNASGISPSTFLGVVLLAIGAVILSMGLEQKVNLAEQYLKRNNVLRDQKKIKRIATKMKYSFDEGKRHTIVKDSYGNKVTTIPRHAGDIPTGTARSIMKDMADSYQKHIDNYL
ncbi:hypothetical protein GOV11_02780 [Candidatus Woesearchaeota archaeon]|nr:hypothetical protein [Candidatus Woesearchaeota archaeon]